jgi:hypothetical protein
MPLILLFLLPLVSCVRADQLNVLGRQGNHERDVPFSGDRYNNSADDSGGERMLRSAEKPLARQGWHQLHAV